MTKQEYQTAIRTWFAAQQQAKEMYLELQHIMIEEIGQGLFKGNKYYTYKYKEIYSVKTITIDENEVYINAHIVGALKFPASWLYTENWQDLLRKRLEKRRNAVILKKLAE